MKTTGREKEKSIIKNSFGQSHEFIKRVVREGDIAIDATAGNGGDTLFLAGLTGILVQKVLQQ